MSDTLPQASSCCLDCAEPTVTAIPGPEAAAGAAGAAGTDGIDPFSFVDGGTTAVPALGALSAAIPLRDPQGSRWMAVGQEVYASPYGYFEVNSIPDDNSVVLLNSGDGTAYPANIDNTVDFADGTKIVPAGISGPAGTAGASGAPDTGTYIVQTSDAALPAAQALDTLATGLVKSTTGTGVVSIIAEGVADGNVAPVDQAAGMTAGQAVFATASGLESKVAATARTALGLGTLSVQNANTAAITGGAITGTTIAGSTGSFTTLAVSGAVSLSGALALIPTTLQTVAAANVITPSGKVRVAGDGGAVVLTSTPTITPGAIDGQLCLVQGTHDTNTVQLQDDGSLAGSKLRLGAANRTLGAGDSVLLSWDATLGMWCEISFTALV